MACWVERCWAPTRVGRRGRPGGLETALFTLLVTLAFLQGLDALEHRAPHALVFNALLLALAAMTRPDGLLFAGATFAVFAVQVTRGLLPARRLLGWMGLLAAVYGPYFAWRSTYYGHLLPNTFAVKAGGGVLLTAGLAYVRAAAARLHPELLLIPGVALVALRAPAGPTRRELALCAALVLPFTSYVAWVGGDFMDLFRFLAPLMPVLAWLGALWMGALAASLASRSAGGRTAAAAVALLLIAAWTGTNLRASTESTRAWNRRGLDSIGLLRQYAADWTLVGKFFATTARASDTLATSAAGIIPYYSRLYTIDELGLVAADLSKYRRLASPRPGHVLAITGRALMEDRPQFLLGHPVVVSDRSQLPAGVPIEPGWGVRIGRYYRSVAVSLSEDPPRYVTFQARLDAAARLR